MRGLNVHKNIPVSITKLMLGLRVGFISSHLTLDKLFPVNPRVIMGPPKMSLLLKAKSMPALIMKPSFILVTQMDVLGWYITSNLQGKMFIQNLNRIVRKKNVMPRQFSYCTTDSIPIDLMFHENSPTHTQVWNCLSHQNDSGLGGSDMLGLSWSQHFHTELISNVTPLWFGGLEFSQRLPLCVS